MSDSTMCSLCGKPLKEQGSAQKSICAVCGSISESRRRCEKGHFVCEVCDGLNVMDFIERYAVHCAGEDPLSIAVALMRSPKFRMHGPEHIFLAAAALLAVYYNRLKDFEAKRAKIADAKYRLSKLSESLINEYGMSPVGIASGLFAALISNATPYTPREWQMSNAAASKAYDSIARFQAVRCDKRDTFLTVIESLHFIREYFDLIFAHRGVECEFAALNPDCMGKSCPFYATNWGSEKLL